MLNNVLVESLRNKIKQAFLAPGAGGMGGMPGMPPGAGGGMPPGADPSAGLMMPPPPAGAGMPPGMSPDPSGGQMPPGMDPAAMGGMPPDAGGAPPAPPPTDPAAAGGAPPPDAAPPGNLDQIRAMIREELQASGAGGKAKKEKVDPNIALKYILSSVKRINTALGIEVPADEILTDEETGGGTPASGGDSGKPKQEQGSIKPLEPVKPSGTPKAASEVEQLLAQVEAIRYLSRQ